MVSGGMAVENMSEMLKGVLEGIVLEIIDRGEIYGYEIVKCLTRMGYKDIAEGTVYALLMRLERNRLVNIVKKPSEIGPPRKFYTLNERGRDELLSFWARWDFMSNCLEVLRNSGGNKNEL